MIELESSLHLFQPPLYQSIGNNWHNTYKAAVTNCSKDLTLDIAAVLSILSFGYPCGNRTLFNEIKRRPWLCQIQENGMPRLENIPIHSRKWESPSRIAENLQRLLCDEALEVCHDYKEIYLLLSGGLDSRIIAAILAKLLDEGKLSCKVTAVTWGLPDSRDVCYGHTIADILGFEWIHIDISPDNLKHNIKIAAINLGCLVSPNHLHGMSWFKNVTKDALVLAASYGDSVGRAEFSGKNILELNYLKPTNPFGLLKSKVLDSAYGLLTQDLKDMHNRTPGQPKYVLCEHEMQGHYMRGLIAHAMSLINNFCSVYQMFTHPNVYSYMWSIHPSLRTDESYAILLEHFHKPLARIPWARTNKSLKGRTVSARSELRPSFQNYKKWISEPFYDQMQRYIDPEWFADTGIFNLDKIRVISKIVKHSQHGRFKPYDIWLWLASFREFVEYFSKQRTIKFDRSSYARSTTISPIISEGINGTIKSMLSRSSTLFRFSKKLRDSMRKMRRKLILWKAIRKYPPDK